MSKKKDSGVKKSTKSKPVDKKQQPNLDMKVATTVLGECAQKYVDLLRKKEELTDNLSIAAEVVVARMKEEKKEKFVCDGVELTVKHTAATDKLQAKRNVE